MNNVDTRNQLQKTNVRKTFFTHFNFLGYAYCYSRKLNNKINRLHERYLRVTYNDGLSSFEELLERDNSVSVYNRNIQCLAIEYKVFNGICPDIMKDVFPISTSSNYDIRSRRTFTTRSVKTVHYGTESYLAPKVWELIPKNIKSFENLPKIKKAIKNWKPDVCRSRLCRLYIVGFVSWVWF